MAALTAWQALFDTTGIRAGQTVFIPGGAGGVGHFAIQLAKWKGAHVITTTSTRNIAFVRELGADVVIDYTQQTLTDTIPEVDVVLDTLSDDALWQAFKKVKRGGFVVSLLRAHKELGEQFAEKTGTTFTFILVHPSGRELAEIANLCSSGHLKVSVEAAFPLQKVAQAHIRSESRQVRGKLVLTM